MLPFGSNHWLYTYPARCLWDAPSYMTSRRPLKAALSDYDSSITNNSTICAFFQDTLEIPNFNASHLLIELRWVRKQGLKSYSSVNLHDIYRQLQNLCLDMSVEDLQTIRYVEVLSIELAVLKTDPCLPTRTSFQSEGLIYSLPQRSWHRSTACVWYKRPLLPDQVAISEQYSEFETFFCQSLQIQVPDLKMLVSGLKTLEGINSVREARELIWQINALDPDKKTLEPLANASVLPVKLKDGTVILRKPSSTFAIIDRKPLADALDGHITFLDFSLEDIRLLRPFLSALKLEGRYLSQLVVEKSSVQGIFSQPSVDLTRYLRRRAHSLTR